jgi:rfaE bifunctional protein nucleotidyltransferase chain/domain
MKHKIITLDQIAAQANQLRAAGRRIVATNGCFDILHVGHVRYLEAARALGDALFVGVNADAAVAELKGPARPVNRAADRAEVLAALEAVDLVTIFPEARATHFLELVRPEIYVKGGDYTEDTLDPEDRAALKAIDAEIRIIPLAPGYSTTGLLQRLSREND